MRHPISTANIYSCYAFMFFLQKSAKVAMEESPEHARGRAPPGLGLPTLLAPPPEAPRLIASLLPNNQHHNTNC